jgi:hypothetical protein
MSKHKILVVLILALGLSCCANAELVGWWKLDETEGTEAWDSSGNELHGEVIGGTKWIPNGRFGGALEFDGVGTAGTNVSLPISELLSELTNSTFAIWANFHQTGGAWQRLWDFGDGSANGYMFLCPRIGTTDTGTLRYAITLTSNGNEEQLNAPFTLPTDWHHVAIALNAKDGNMIMYVDGEVIDEQTTTIFPANLPPTTQNWLGQSQWPDGIYDGALDDFRIYDQALTAEEIALVMIGAGSEYPFASSPKPANGAIHAETWANISWRPGDFAVSHDVYIGDNFEDVDAGAESTFVGNQTDTFFVAGFPGFPIPDGLVPGTTYYWRIDEVNDAEPNSPWKGDVWSFMIPPKTAYFPDPDDGAEGVGINGSLSWTSGFDAKLHTVYFGETFEEVEGATGGSPQGNTKYNPGTLKMAKTYYWRVDEFDIVETHKGDIWSFTTEGAVGNPNPAKGAEDVSQTPVLIWIPGLGATYEIYFGTDASALELKGSGNLGSESYEPGQLEWNTTYYWRIDEANSANADSPWTGPLWSFTTADFLIIDNMESYNDLDPADPASNRIFNAWIDGYGDPTNGSLVGYENPPFAEQTIVHGGNQSMPMYYDNSAGKSEATLTLTSNSDWTVNGVNTLTIWFRAETGNAAEQMYVALNGNARIDHDDPDAATLMSWSEWNIPLQAFVDFGVNLSNINSITLGLSSVSGGTGTMYFDDIRLVK